MTRTLAAADIGSNTAHLLIAATDGTLVTRIDNFNEWIPLGEVVSREGKIPGEILEQLVAALKEFKRMAAARKVEKLYVFATEGMRMAQNHAQVLKKIRGETGIEVDLIPPQREAEFSTRGVSLDSRHLGPNLLFEVGGGSVQIGRLENGRLTDECSLPLGTGRVITVAGLRNPCPVPALQAAETYIEETLERCPIQIPGAVGVVSGGVGRGLWRALHPDGEKVLYLEELDYMVWSTSRLSSDRIANRFSVKSRRAGTLLPGALIYRALLRRFGLKETFVSEFGVREGAILEMAAGRVPCPA